MIARSRVPGDLRASEKKDKEWEKEKEKIKKLLSSWVGEKIEMIVDVQKVNKTPDSENVGTDLSLQTPPGFK